MNRRNIAGFAKNAMSTVFLLAGAFFVCSTFLSMRAVFADPIAPTVASASVATSPRASASARSPRTTAASRARTTTNTASRTTTTTPTRNVVARTTTAPVRNVVSRGTTNRTTSTRNVVARTITPSRVSLTGSAIRGNLGSAATNTYTYLSNRLYTGNYSNIIDSTTGLISAEAYQNCLESYYTCMDEICTARSAAKRRCSCAARVTNFIDAEEKLKAANEELIKASGELALLIANKGKDVSEAFQLTDAEKVMNCVSWQETTSRYGNSSDQAIKWCSDHNIWNNGQEVTACNKPSYCSESGNNFGFDITNIEGSSSDILATLQAWADAKDKSLAYVKDDETNLLSAYTSVSTIVSNLSGISSSAETTVDSLANTWGYELFGYAHNNVCSRVLDSCFNGIYEACGTPPSNGRCANGGSGSCPYNFNSKITISKSGDVTLNERNTSTTSTAACFGYTTTTTTNGVTTTSDPYASLRGPVADARRSVMQKYLLDANADCDVYGEELKTTAQNIGYQKIAAQQALQQKRLEFKNAETESVRSRALTAYDNFKECIDEISECYETQMTSHGPGSTSAWTASRIRTYCAQLSNAPHCYEEMVCNPSTSQYIAVIDYADNNKCFNSQDYTKNSCRNVVTLSEILNKIVTEAVSESDVGYDTETNDQKCIQGTICSGSKDSKKIREYCLTNAGVDSIRDWTKTIYKPAECKVQGMSYDEASNNCVSTSTNP